MVMITLKGKLLIAVVIIAVASIGVWRWWDKIAPAPASSTTSMNVADINKKFPKLKVKLKLWNKTRLRLRQHDTIWKQVCEKLGWSWLPTEIQLDKPKRVAKRKPPRESKGTKVILQKWPAKCLAKFLTVDLFYNIYLTNFSELSFTTQKPITQKSCFTKSRGESGTFV